MSNMNKISNGFFFSNELKYIYNEIIHEIMRTIKLYKSKIQGADINRRGLLLIF